MILQNIIFPQKDICDCEGLYFNSCGNVCLKEENILQIEAGAKISFFSYFNAFSIGKWSRYTTVGDIELSLEMMGSGRVTLGYAVLENEEYHCDIIEEYEANYSERGVLQMNYGENRQQGIYYFEIEAKSQMLFWGGSFNAKPEKPPRDINIVVGICTFRREEYVKKTINALAENFAENRESRLWTHLRVFVSDNGNTLPAEELNTEFVHVFPNPNYGGSGGFGRCMLEAVRSKNEFGLTHILLMDDDIILEPESIYRTYVMLSLLRKEYEQYCFGGALLRMDVPYIQHANGERYEDGEIGFTKRGWDLRKSRVLLENEEILPIDYNGWWYCCIPMIEDFGGSLPLPLFIHADDIEYGLRQSGRFITLNGVGVWHDAFDNRRASSMEYYDCRNRLICWTVHHLGKTRWKIAAEVCRHIVFQMLMYRYEDQKLTMQGLEDFLKGPAFLRSQDTAAIHQIVMNEGYRMVDITDKLQECGKDSDQKQPAPDELYPSEGFNLKQKLTLNGWLLPGRKKCAAIPMGRHPCNLYRRKNVLLYEPESGKGFEVHRQYRQIPKTVLRCIKVYIITLSRYKKAAKDYEKNWTSLTNEAFWEKYLGL